ncbi:MAG: HAD-IB family hydrolase [Bacteroidales bacterium]|nr:HAD-IB family hydrolase [Bacteroidales bacterium]
MESTSSEKTEQKGTGYLVFFDLDRTITSTVSGRVIAIAAHRKGMLRRRVVMNALFNSLANRLHLKNQLSIINDMLTWVRGVPVLSLEALCAEVFADTIKPSIYSDAIKEIEMHRSGKAKIVLLSSSLEPLCSLAAVYLGMDDVICTLLDVKNGHYTGLAKGIPCFGKEKVSRMKEYCERNNGRAEDAWYYGDSGSDIPVLDAVGHPVCINPDRWLKKTALRKNWKIFRWS